MSHARNYVVWPKAASAALNARAVAGAYNYPLHLTGKGYTAGIIELGGGFGQSDLDAYFARLGVAKPNVVAVPVADGANKSDGPTGADGEVLLDIEVIGAVAPGAAIRVYFAPNTDIGFLAAIEQATKDGCDTISISWGQAESAWSSSSLDAFDAAFLAARKAGSVVFAASGDSGSTDSTSGNVVDFPASSPNVIGCGGTRLTLDSNGMRAAEVTWNDNPTSSATGGGVSKHFPGRQVPDVAGNADPDSGYEVIVDGGSYVIGGTSAVAPLYAGLVLLLCEGVAGSVGKRVDLMNTLLTNLGVCYDVTAGDNGGYRAGPGRDNVTGLGVVDGAKLLAVLTDAIPDPAPIGSNPAPSPPSPPPPVLDADEVLAQAVRDWITNHRHSGEAATVAKALRAWETAKGLT